MPSRLILAVIAAALFWAAAPVSAAGPIVSHRAAYALTLRSSSWDSGVIDARGAMIYEVVDTCDGWTINQRMQLALVNRDSQQLSTDTQFTSWEGKDGLKYNFSSRTFRNGTLDEEMRGEAELEGEGEGGVARFTLPEPRSIPLPKGTMLPTAHTELLLARAAAGESFLWRLVFDGASDEGLFGASAIIGKPAALAGEAVPEALQGKQSWPLRIAFYPENEKGAEPDYEIRLRMADNGIANDMLIDYGEFALAADLQDLKMLPKTTCK